MLFVFPEGTRSPTGELQEAKDGLAMLAMRTGARIVPIGVNDTDAVWRKGQKLPLAVPAPDGHRPHRRVRSRSTTSCPPARTGGPRRASPRPRIMGRIAALLEPRHRGVYADAIRTDALARTLIGHGARPAA